MPRVPPPRRGPPRNLRLLSVLRKRRGKVDASPNTILAENGYQLQAQNGNFLRTES